jgi:lipoprotein-anchoring transpeptidase ErfK/SrfK
VDSTGEAIKQWGIACAVNYGPKKVRGDHKTPEGTFKITQLLYAKGLSHDFHDGKGPVKDAYGPWFLRLSVPGFIDIGIHGTPFPESIGSRATEGCIRMRNEDVTDLKQRVKVGTTVIILPDAI